MLLVSKTFHYILTRVIRVEGKSTLGCQKCKPVNPTQFKGVYKGDRKIEKTQIRLRFEDRREADCKNVELNLLKPNMN